MIRWSEESRKNYHSWNYGLNKDTDPTLMRFSMEKKGKHFSPETEIKKGQRLYSKVLKPYKYYNGLIYTLTLPCSQSRGFIREINPTIKKVNLL